MRNRPHPEAIIFDLDGTLIDSVPDLARCTNLALAQSGFRRQLSMVEAISYIGLGVDRLIKRAITGEMWGEPDTDVFEQVKQAFSECYRSQYADHSSLYPNVWSSLQVLQKRNIPLGIVTNKPIIYTDLILKTFDLTDFFGVVIGGDSTAEKKPHSLPLLTAMDVLNVKPETCWFVGDSEVDVKTAEQANCYMIAMTYGYNQGKPIKDANPDLCLDHFELIPSLLD